MNTNTNTNTNKPVTVSGWYERTDGTVAYYAWIEGRLVTKREARDWDHVHAIEEEEQEEEEQDRRFLEA